MAAVVDPVQNPTLCDTIIAELHYANSPFALLYSMKSTIDIYGNCSFVFPSVVLFQNYYIVLHHRNAIETWSNPVLFNSSVMNFDFTNADNVFGHNVADLKDGNYALWSGDVTNGTFDVQDGFINHNDHINIEKFSQLFQTGYLSNDITGDGIVESSDFSLIEFNSSQLITVARP